MVFSSVNDVLYMFWYIIQSIVIKPTDNMIKWLLDTMQQVVRYDL